MPKQKTNKGYGKRFKVTATGKIKHKKINRGHKLSHKGGKRTRQLRGDNVLVSARQTATIIEALRPGM
ncbi:MAG: 50S ribosomal protein L35 [Planctomycetaceae bacterium]